MDTVKVLVNGKNLITLNKNNYKASGGEGTVYQKNGIAYKIYTDPNKMIPLAKIKELMILDQPNILRPLDVLYDQKTQNPVGFTMTYVDDIEFLCRLFNKSFRKTNGVTPDNVIQIIKKMQQTLTEIHRNKSLVVDFNEMNFLIDRKFTTPYFIDVDSYQTPSFPATALMDSVRDRKSPNKFTELTDWFSFAVVSFYLYMGIHPFKGIRDDYTNEERAKLKMMDDGISVFHKDVRIPVSCQDWSVIPKPHLEWYKKVFLNGERSIPPLADGITIISTSGISIINSNSKFDVKDYGIYDSNILHVYDFNNTLYVLTDKKVYSGKRELFRLNRKYNKMELCSILGEDPVLAYTELGNIIFEDKNRNEIGKIRGNDLMQLNGAIYTVTNGNLMENTCIKIGQGVFHKPRIACQIFDSSYKIFPGLVMQDVLGKIHAAVPYKIGACINIAIPELDGRRIIDAEYQNGKAIFMTESKGKYSKFFLCFASDFSRYTIREENNVNLDGINFTVLPNGVCVSITENEKVEVFVDNSKLKLTQDPPFDSSMKLYRDGQKVLFSDTNKLYSVTLK